MFPINGVHREARSMKWRAKYYRDGKRINLGLFEKLEDANAARRAAEEKWGLPRNGHQSYDPVVNEKIAELAMKGMTSAQIGAELGLKPKHVGARVTAMIRKQMLPRAAERKGRELRPKSKYKIAGVKFGSMSEMVFKLKPEQIQWLANQVPPGGKVADVVRAIVTDAYLDEVEG